MIVRKGNPFIEVSRYYDLESLFHDLTECKDSKSSLSLTEQIYICGLLSGCTPTQISDKIGYSPASLRVELCRVGYPMIAKLTGEDKIKWQDVPRLLEHYKYPKLKVLRQDMFNIPFSLNINSSNQFKVTYVISVIEKSQETQKKLNDSDKSLMMKLVEEGKDLSSKDPYGAIKISLKALKIHGFQIAAIVNIIHFYDRLEQYYNSFAVCDLVLLMLKNDSELTLKDLSIEEKNEEQKKYYAQTYTYLGKTMYELAKKDKICSCVKTAYDFYNEALYFSPYNAIVSSNIVDLHTMAIKNDFFNEIETKNQFILAEKAMENLITVAHNPKSNFKQYKDRIINDAVLYCDGLDPWWQKKLEILKSLD
jgi:hypothetical protein